MLQMSMNVTGIEEVLARVDRLEALYLIYVNEQLEWFGRTAVTSMTEDHPPGGPHPPPGEQPQYGEHSYIDRTGYLMASIGFDIESLGAGVISVVVFAMAPYAEAVEEGTARARAYQFFWPVIEDMLPELYDRVGNAVRQAFAEMAEE